MNAVPRSVWGALDPKPDRASVYVFTLRSFDHCSWWRVECVWREIAKSVAIIEAKYFANDGREHDEAQWDYALAPEGTDESSEAHEAATRARARLNAAINALRAITGAPARTTGR